MKYRVTLNNRTYEIGVEHGKAMLLDEYEALAPAAKAAAPVAPAAPAAAPAAPAAAAASDVAMTGNGQRIVAPMPGSIFAIPTSEGQKVKKGDVLIVLEAMKMENEITAPCDGTVTKIAVVKSQTVETGAVLVVLGE